MSVLDFIFLLFAAGFAGFVDAVAGGGGLIQLPALLIGLNENTSTSHTVGVRYVDSFGGFSSMASASFVASGSATKLDAPAALTLYIKR